MNTTRALAVAAVAAMEAMLVGTSLVDVNDAFAGKKGYEKNQATSQANACGNGELPLNVYCQNINSQIQGDETAVAPSASQGQ
ncbi:MAG: hypothetical protein ACRD47_10145 [Nitrososphaeraceae archaeon]